MSEYGPALFVSRVDGAEMPEEERATVMRYVVDACRSLAVTDAVGDGVRPEVYDYSGYEPGALGVLLHSSSLFAIMPDEVRADEEDGWQDDATLIAAELEQRAPGTYKLICYAVEG